MVEFLLARRDGFACSCRALVVVDHVIDAGHLCLENSFVRFRFHGFLLLHIIDSFWSSSAGAHAHLSRPVAVAVTAVLPSAFSETAREEYRSGPLWLEKNS